MSTLYIDSLLSKVGMKVTLVLILMVLSGCATSDKTIEGNRDAPKSNMVISGKNMPKERSHIIKSGEVLACPAENPCFCVPGTGTPYGYCTTRSECDEIGGSCR